MADYGPTQEIVDGAYEEDEEEEETRKAPEVWGRLLPLTQGFAACGGLRMFSLDLLACNFSLVLLDLVKDEYTFGRGEECDHVFVQRDDKASQHFSTFSKVHFRLFLVRVSVVTGNGMTPRLPSGQG